jgi:hypothetical protein
MVWRASWTGVRKGAKFGQRQTDKFLVRLHQASNEADCKFLLMEAYSAS